MEIPSLFSYIDGKKYVKPFFLSLFFSIKLKKNIIKKLLPQNKAINK